ncbi:MAG: peptidylprolyl isomerase [Rhodocyclaceae bacterium]|nr:peptidylprolyl isomerase [Rhodocyclaceae bacterium]MDZ4213450.1 peptidylprolyl isomerase [Rhodocyclaceae bacterium]
MKRALLSLSLLAIFSAPALAAGPVTKVNGKIIPANRAEVLIANQIAQGQAKTPELEAAVKEELVRREVLAQAAAKQGIDKKPDVQAQLDLARQGVMIGAYLNEYARNVKISDADVQKEYDVINAAVGKNEYKARHILVESEGEAKDIIAKLKGGAKFDDLAKASKDPGSKDRGGELGWGNKASYVQPFSEAMTKLNKGQYTEAPVQSQFGWHVIQLDDTRELKAPPIDEVKPQIVQRMRQMAVEKHILDLRAKAKVE